MPQYIPGEQLLPQKCAPSQLKSPEIVWYPVNNVGVTHAEMEFTSSDPLDAPVKSCTWPQKLKASFHLSGTLDPSHGLFIHHCAPRDAAELMALQLHESILLFMDEL